MSKSLWNIGAELQQIEDALYENGGELTPELEADLHITQEELAAKAESYIALIQKSDMEADLIDAEIRRLTTLKKSRQNVGKHLRERLTNAMLAFDIKQVKLPLATISIRQSEATEVVDVEILPEQYQRVKITREADKTAIKEALKNGEEIHGCSIKINHSLQIR